MAERSADDIKRDIEKSRAELASAVDQLAYRGNPKRIAENAKQSVKARLNTPQGQAVLAVVGGVVVVLVIKRFRKDDEPKAIEKAKAQVKKKAKKRRR